MALNLNHNIEKIIGGSPYFPCFCTVSWFSSILSWFSKIFRASLLLLGHRNILFYLTLEESRYLYQVPRCQAINLNNIDLYLFITLLILGEDPSYVAFSSDKITRVNKNKVSEFFLLPLKLLILFVSKFCLIYPNLATQRMLQIISVSENLHRQGSRTNRSNLCLEYISL